LISYLAGDGYPTKELTKALLSGKRLKDIKCERIVSATSSRWLAVDLQYLLSSLGLNYSLKCSDGEERIIHGRRAVFSETYTFYIYVKQKLAHTSKIPIEVIKSCNDPKLKYGISRCNQSYVFVESLQNRNVELFDERIISGDLGGLVIKQIEEIEYDKEWVYDVSVPECENFVAGFGPILCHNSLDACEEAGILPDILVRITRIDKSVYRIIVEDNGPGIVKHQIPKIFGKLLYGSRFHAIKQTRGQQGIGISSAVLYAQLTTGKPAVIISKTSPKEKAWRMEILIDTKKNEPEVVSEEQIDWHRPRGTRIELEVVGSYVRERKQSVYEYLRETSVVNPHAKITFVEPDGSIHEFPRVGDQLPAMPKEIKPHPHGIELGTLINMLKTTRARDLKSFLKSEFVRVGDKIAEEILGKAGLSGRLNPKALSREDAVRLLNAFKEVQLLPPPTDCLAPIGSDLIMKSLMTEFKAEFVYAVTRKPKVYSGHPYLVEVGIAYGGEIKSDRVSVLRFANKIPLLYQQGGCALTKAVESVNWKAYGLQQSKNELPTAPAVILIHLASTNIPYTSESKEAIASIPEIVDEARLALQEVGRKLKEYLDRKEKLQKKKKKEEVLYKIIPLLAKKVCEVLEKEDVDADRIIARIMGKVYFERIIDGEVVRLRIANYSRSKKEFKIYEMCEGIVEADAKVVQASAYTTLIWNVKIEPNDEIELRYRLKGRVVNKKPIVDGLDETTVSGAEISIY
jgi:DNA topoisomerase-6 subunit B